MCTGLGKLLSHFNPIWKFSLNIRVDSRFTHNPNFHVDSLHQQPPSPRIPHRICEILPAGNAIFTALPHKHNGQAALKSTMKVKRSVLHVGCLQIKDEWRIKPGCVTDFTCIFSENQVHSAVCVSVSSKSFFKNYLAAVHSRCVFDSFRPFWAIWRVWWQISKNAVSVTKKT